MYFNIPFRRELFEVEWFCAGCLEWGLENNEISFAIVDYSTFFQYGPWGILNGPLGAIHIVLGPQVFIGVRLGKIAGQCHELFKMTQFGLAAYQ